MIYRDIFTLGNGPSDDAEDHQGCFWFPQFDRFVSVVAANVWSSSKCDMVIVVQTLFQRLWMPVTYFYNGAGRQKKWQHFALTALCVCVWLCTCCRCCVDKW